MVNLADIFSYFTMVEKCLADGGGAFGIIIEEQDSVKFLDFLKKHPEFDFEVTKKSGMRNDLYFKMTKVGYNIFWDGYYG